MYAHSRYATDILYYASMLSDYAYNYVHLTAVRLLHKHHEYICT